MVSDEGQYEQANGSTLVILKDNPSYICKIGSQNHTIHEKNDPIYAEIEEKIDLTRNGAYHIVLPYHQVNSASSETRVQESQLTNQVYISCISPKQSYMLPSPLVRESERNSIVDE